MTHVSEYLIPTFVNTSPLPYAAALPRISFDLMSTDGDAAAAESAPVLGDQFSQLMAAIQAIQHRMDGKLMEFREELRQGQEDALKVFSLSVQCMIRLEPEWIPRVHSWTDLDSMGWSAGEEGHYAGSTPRAV